MRRTALLLILALTLTTAGCIGQISDVTGATPPGAPSADVAELEALKAELREREATITMLQEEVDSLNEVLNLTYDQVADLQMENRNLEKQLNSFQATGNYSQETIDAAREVGRSIRDSVVYLDVEGGQGTGWFIGEGLVVTNWHVIDAAIGGGTITGWTVTGDSFNAEIVNYSEEPDVALLRTDYTGAPALPTAERADLAEEQLLVQVGHPGGVGYWIISLGRHLSTSDMGGYGDVTTTIPGLSGVSGSPVVDMEGNVVALTYGGTPHFQGAQPGEAPTVTRDRVYVEPMAESTDGLHVPIEDVLALVEAWR